MDFRDFFVQSASFRLLKADVDQNRVNHAYLLCGADDLSLDTVATAFACAILCQSKTKPCFECPSCKKVLAGVHSDVILLPLGEKVLTEDIERLLQSSNFMPTESSFKIFNVARAHTMTTAAQNKLLKTLEEPHAQNIIILKAQTTSTLLPTVKSRLKSVSIEPLDFETTKEALIAYGASPQDAEEAAALSFGSLSLALRLLSDKDCQSAIELAFDILVQMNSSSEILPFSAKCAKIKQIDIFLDSLQAIFRDSIVINLKCDDLCRFNFKKRDIIQIAQKYTQEAASLIIDKIGEAKRKLSLNCNQTGVCDELLFYMLEVRAKCPRL